MHLLGLGKGDPFFQLLAEFYEREFIGISELFLVSLGYHMLVGIAVV